MRKDTSHAAGKADSRALVLRSPRWRNQLLFLPWFLLTLHLSETSVRRGWFIPHSFDNSAKESAPNLDPSLQHYIELERLDREDVLLYQHLFSLARQKQWADFDHAAAHLKNPALLAWLKAGELTSPAYEPTEKELRLWLEDNAILPQAASVQRRLAQSDPAAARAYLPLALPAISHAGFDQPRDMLADLNVSQRSAMTAIFESFSARRYGLAYRNSAKLAREAKKTLPGAWWIAGISATHLGKTAEAYHAFATLADWADENQRNEWLADASFWAYRTAKANGDMGHALQHLHMAATPAQGFYSQIAAAELEERKPVAAQQTVSFRDVGPNARSLIAIAAMLHEIGHTAEASGLLRHSFLHMTPEEQRALLLTVEQLQLSDVQIPMAYHLFHDDVAGAYPIPAWKDDLQLDAALIMAVVRRESGFDGNAGSQAGAQGLMQIMPATAESILHQSNIDLKDAGTNLAIGQDYLRYLAARPEIAGNLVRLLASYNAGPSGLSEWDTHRDDNDPLLFIESIPYKETREYVKNVLSDAWIYDALLKKRSQSLSDLASGRWPRLGA